MTILPPYTILIIQNGTKMKTTSKIVKAQEVITALEFLGLGKENFLTLKNQHGGFDGLYAWIEKQLN